MIVRPTVITGRVYCVWFHKTVEAFGSFVWMSRRYMCTVCFLVVVRPDGRHAGWGQRVRQLRIRVHAAVAQGRHRTLLVQRLRPLPQDERHQQAAHQTPETTGKTKTTRCDQTSRFYYEISQIYDVRMNNINLIATSRSPKYDHIIINMFIFYTWNGLIVVCATSLSWRMLVLIWIQELGNKNNYCTHCTTTKHQHENIMLQKLIWSLTIV